MPQSWDWDSRLADTDAPVQPEDGEPHCDTCGNMRFIVAGGILKPCPTCGVVQQRITTRISRFSSVNANSLAQGFDNFVPVTPALADIVSAARAFAEKPHKRWLYIYGPPGSGKSHLCAAVNNALAARGLAPLFITMADLMSSLYEALERRRNGEPMAYGARMDAYKQAAVLILDDLGAEGDTAFVDTVTFELLDYRYRNKLSTMIASNLSPDHLNPRVASRIGDASLGAVLYNDAPDYRRRGAGEQRSRGAEEQGRSE